MNSNEINVFTLGTMLASDDLSSKQFFPVKVHTDGTIKVCGAGEAGIGFLRNKPTAGLVCEIMNTGVALAVVGDTVTAGDTVMAHANGIQPHTGTNAKLGVALESGAIGEVISVITGQTSVGTNVSYGQLVIPFDLDEIANGDLVTNFTMGFAGTIKKFDFITKDPATTADKLSTINLEIGSTNVTGGVISLTTASCSTMGKVTAGTAITAGATFGASDTISIEASSTTAFVEGNGVFVITYSS